MAQFEIYWNDLTDEAKNRLSDLYDDNIHLTPLAIIEVEETEQLTQKESDIQFIKHVVEKWGNITSSELELDSSPIIGSVGDGDIVELIEKFDKNSVSTIIYNNGTEVEERDFEYEELNPDLISEIKEIMENYDTDMQDTMSKASGYDF